MGVRFSVVMPVYNREKYLRQAVDSVLSQNFASFELIAVDDGSTDRSMEILKSYGSRIKVIGQRNSGPEVARNTGVAAARGEYISFLDSDDFFFPWTLETYDRVIRAFGSPPLIIGSEHYYADGTPIPALPAAGGAVEVLEFKDCLSKTVSLSIMTSLYVVRKSAYEGIGGFRKSNSQTWWGDITDFVLKLATQSPFIIVRSPQTTAYRIHEENSTKSLRAHADGLLGVARSEREGVYPGGPERRWERYALIGGISAQWAIAYCWRGGERKAALKLLFGAAPMVAAAVWNKFWRRFQAPTPVTVLPKEEPVANASREGAMPVQAEEHSVGTRH
jgi:glycosyltransferase involved in cell wall biosynthesis